MLSDRFQKQVIFSGLFKVIKENLPIIYYLLKAIIKIIFGTFYFSMVGRKTYRNYLIELLETTRDNNKI